jgi:hypothetical protein
MKLSI